MNTLRTRMKNNVSTVVIYLMVIVFLIAFLILQHDFTKYGMKSLGNQMCVLCLVTMAQTLIILTGGIDMSNGAMCALLNCITAVIVGPITEAVGPVAGIFLTIVAVLLCGALFGLLNGLIVVYAKLQPIIVTIATSSIFAGLALLVLPLPGGDVPRTYTKFIAGFALGVIPVSFIIILIGYVLIWRNVRHSRLGHAIYAIGGNETSAYLSGINVDRVKLINYALAGVVVAIAALFLTGQSSSGDPNGCSSYAVRSITASVIGGVSLSGGEGGYGGSLGGAILLSLIIGILIFLGISSFYQDIFQGVLLILVLAVNAIREMRRKEAEE